MELSGVSRRLFFYGIVALTIMYFPVFTRGHAGFLAKNGRKIRQCFITAALTDQTDREVGLEQKLACNAQPFFLYVIRKGITGFFFEYRGKIFRIEAKGFGQSTSGQFFRQVKLNILLNVKH